MRRIFCAMLLLLGILSPAALSGEILGIRPHADGVETLGTPTFRYSKTFTNIISDGVNEFTPADVVSRMVGSTDHSALTMASRGLPDQHPQSAISGLSSALSTINSRITNEIAAEASARQTADTQINNTLSAIEGVIGDLPSTYVLSETFAPVQAAFPADATVDNPLATEAYVDSADALKADIVDGVVPDWQLPSDVKVKNWGPVPTEADLVTFTEATVNDRAWVGTDPGPYTVWYLLALPPTTQSNWYQSSGGGSSTPGVETVNGLTGPVVNVDLENFPGVQNALDDKANASDLAKYLPLTGGTVTGNLSLATPTAGSSTRLYFDRTDATQSIYYDGNGNCIIRVRGIGNDFSVYDGTTYVSFKESLDKKLPLTGGRLSGQLSFSSNLNFGPKLINLDAAAANYFGIGTQSDTVTYHSNANHDFYLGTAANQVAGSPNVRMNNTDLYVQGTGVLAALNQRALKSSFVTTTTDPGEGAPLAAGTFLFVYEE